MTAGSGPESAFNADAAALREGCRACELREKARAAQVALDSARAAAGAAARAKSAFLANVGHELRTPMNGVLGMLQVLERRNLDPGARGCVQVAEASAKALNALLERILAYARLEVDDLAPANEAFDLADLMADVVATVRPAAANADVRLLTAVAPGAPNRVIGDAHKLRQILVELADNDIRFGAATVSLSLDVTPSAHGLDLIACVEDDGPGVPADLRDRIFERFQQGDASNTRARSGVGLGLALCRALARAVDGEVELDPGPGEGARFKVRAPVTAAPDARRGQDGHAGADRERLNILVVEDHPVNEQVLVALLDLFGQTAAVAHNGAEAVAAAAREDFDLILMDIQMPVMDGLSATKAIRDAGGRNAGAPIFAVTASASADDLERYRAAGLNGLAPKPIQPERLLSVLEAAAQWRETAGPGQGGLRLTH